jgi:hypothetical protein
MSGGRTAAVGAAVAGAFAIYANPRSLVALIVIWVAVAAATVSRPTSDQPRCSTTTGRLALVLGVTTLVAAPELISLIRFADLYDFVRYTSYADLADYGRSAIDAVSPPVFALGIAGVLVGLLVPGRPITRVAALALLLYGGATMMLVVWPGASPLVAGLEVTRLMPFQRFLTIYLAAAALPELLNWLNPRGRRAFKDAMLVVAAVGVLVLHAGPPNVPPPNPAGPAPTTALYPVSTTATGEQVEFEQAIRAADAAAAPGTAILVIGSVLSWHQQLWAPLWTERPLYYDNWLWYWQPDHAGPPGYRFRAGHHYPTPELALAPDYLTRHGIGAVVVTGPVKPVAARSRDLVPIRVGAYDAYTVERPTTSVTFDGSNAIASEVADQRIVAVGASAGGEVLIRRNWFPRWRATIDGRPVQITRTPDGYMSVTAPPGQVRLELRYVVDRFDWLARALCLSGIITIGLIACESRWRRGVVRSG